MASLWPDGYVPPSVAGGKEEATRDRVRQRGETKGRRAREGEVDKPEEADVVEPISSALVEADVEPISSALVVRRSTAEKAEHGNNTSSAAGSSYVGDVRAKNGRDGGRRKKKGKVDGGVNEERNVSGGHKKEEKEEGEERRLFKVAGKADSPKQTKELAEELAESKAGKKKKKKKNKDNVSEL